MNIKLLLSWVLLVCLCTAEVSGQFWNPEAGCVQDVNGECVPNTLLTAVPFLRIVPDARGGALGDAGIATSADPYSAHYNSSKLAFVQNDMEVSATFTPWLRNLGLTDVYLLYAGLYKRIDDFQTFGANIRFFSLGDINFTDINGNSSGTGRPREFEIGMSYARKLTDNFSAGIGGKFIYSNLASGQQVGGIDISAGTAFAADISATYISNPDLQGPGSSLSVGLSLTNIGSKITYTQSSEKEFIPANLGIGAAYLINLDDFNSVTFALDFNKLLVPTPIPVDHPDYDTDQNGRPDYREKSTFAGVFGSFADAPGGFSEELKEFSTSFGVEYWYDQQFAVRAGYYYENPLKGARQYITVGVGLRYNVFGIDISYLAPTNVQRSPLDNTLRFSFSFALGEGGLGGGGGN